MPVINRLTVEFKDYYSDFMQKISQEDAYRDADCPEISKKIVRRHYNNGCDTEEAVMNTIREGVLD